MVLWATSLELMTASSKASTRMRAISQDVAGGPEVLDLVELDRPAPGPTEILVRVHAAGVNPTFWKSRARGQSFSGAIPPFALGYDVSGVVEEIPLAGLTARSRQPTNRWSMSMSSPDSTATVVDSFFTRFGAGDIPGLLDLFADRIDFSVNGAPNIPWAGQRSERAELTEFFQSFGAVLTPPEEFTINTRVVEGDNAVVLGRNRFEVLATGKKFTNDFALHFTVEGGKITGYHMYEDSYAISSAFTR